MSKLTLLLIEDNVTIARQLAEFFQGHGWQLDYAANGALGIELATNNIYDVILLDLNLPDIDGLKVCSAIKQQASITPPVLMLTARDAFEDKARGFGEGADDYVTKPFEFRELALRCQALARRQQLHQSQTLTLGDLVISQNERTAKRQGQLLKLTHIGFNILLTLAQAYPQAVSRSNLIYKVWGNEPPDSDALRSHIYTLRNVLDKPFDKPMLTTITNVGFKLELAGED
ncbi:response regulator transcription factor [Thalassomonas viridans]|uniref:Response regulator transcription factor n=1 Tax=Thalassomonas viridans TaxID=137584 RepID=A0AAF0C880_9GAMM|nr:response regulator transcription factor [Thalassomonas viridans]WDE03599.1 response regulator transcription factor [Thalassomonas viridans]